MKNAALEVTSINLVYDYPVRWSRFKVLRDFVQNFYDAVQWRRWDSQFSYTLAEGALTLKASGVGFSYDWLLHIGASTKREETGGYAGYFGEGFKIAALCALRDYSWQVSVCSRDWRLKVVTADIDVDGRRLKSLAYEIEKSSAISTDTVLQISPFSDAELLESVLLSFYYPSNPLFGEKIYEADDCAVYFRSKVEKPRRYPTTSGDRSQGIVFASYQALGSFQYPLVFCLHDYRHNDRDRNSFFKMDVVRLINRTVSRLTPTASSVVLQSLKGRWYDRPRKKYDFESWHGIVDTLVRNVSRSEEAASTFRADYPNLLVAHQVKRNDLQRYNRRRQALDWLKNSGRSFRLVQSAFSQLGYPTLESVCERHDGFSVTREPTAYEQKRVDLLEAFVQTLMPDLFASVELPPCQIIKSERAAWMGMANCVLLTTSKHQTFRGIPVRYRLPYVALKSSLLQSAAFGSALSTYLHELAHMFGGDRSAAFSHALSELMEITLSNARLVATWQEDWEALS